MSIRDLFRGIAVIVDDEIGAEGKTINTIIDDFKKCNIPVVAYDSIPNESIIDSLLGASFVILDWRFFQAPDGLYQDGEGGLGQIQPPQSLMEEVQGKLIGFIKKLLEKLFIPVFIFSAQEESTIHATLEENDVWKPGGTNRIFVINKSEVASSEDLFLIILDWIKTIPAVYVLKKWEAEAERIKNDMFLELYEISPNWPRIIMKALMKDSKDDYEIAQHEFGMFLTRIFENRFDEFEFEEDYMLSSYSGSDKELIKVLEQEKYIKYEKKQKQAHTGDLFCKTLEDGKKEYLLNIRAQCDLCRDKDPELYLIRGDVRDSIITKTFKFDRNNNLYLNGKIVLSFDELKNLESERRKNINTVFSEYSNKVIFDKGALLGKRTEFSISCIDGQKAITFSLAIDRIEHFKKMQEDYTLIGRIIPPYITQIQQQCSSNIVREGVYPIPEEVFK